MLRLLLGPLLRVAAIGGVVSACVAFAVAFNDYRIAAECQMDALDKAFSVPRNSEYQLNRLVGCAQDQIKAELDMHGAATDLSHRLGSPSRPPR